MKELIEETEDIRGNVVAPTTTTTTRRLMKNIVDSPVSADTVIDVAAKNNADAICCGSRGYGTLKRVVLGSLSS